MGMTEHDSMAEILIRSRVAPEYTMGALAKKTGVPADTLRSWERRYGFPTPARTDTNQRRYSERDIAAVRWLRTQTERGQGISEAVAMVKSRLAPLPVADREGLRDSYIATSQAPPLESLVEALVTGQLDAAQDAWDDIVIALFPGAIGGSVILPAHRRIEQTPGDVTGTSPSLERARAFLLRKATVLLDYAGPDTGQTSFCILTSGIQQDAVPATVLAATLARAGFRINTPFLNAASLESVDALHDLRPDHVIFVGGSADGARAVARLIPGQRIYRWSPDGSTSNDQSSDTLPASLAAVKAFFQQDH
jgi:DNA-binding transcriptional MerR regulator